MPGQRVALQDLGAKLRAVHPGERAGVLGRGERLALAVELPIGEESPFVAVRAVQDRHARGAPVLVRLLRLDRQEVTARHRPPVEPGLRREDLLRGLLPQAGDGGRRVGAARLLREGGALRERLVALAGRAVSVGTALHDARAVEALGGGRRELGADGAAARGLARDGDAPPVAAERADVGADPAQGGLLVEHAVVARDAVGRLSVEALSGEETQGAQAVVDSHDHGAGAPGEGVGHDVLPRARGEPSAVQPDQDGTLLVLTLGRAVLSLGRVHVQVEAVLGVAGVLVSGVPTRRLHTPVAEGVRIAHALPGLGAPGLLPAQVAHGLLCVRDTEELPPLCGGLTAQPARVRTDERAPALPGLVLRGGLRGVRGEHGRGGGHDD